MLFTRLAFTICKTRGVVEWERVGTAFPHLFALDYIKTWLRSHRCANDTQICIATQKSTVKEVPVCKSLKANAHFIRNIWYSLPLHLVWERRSHTSFFSTTPLCETNNFCLYSCDLSLSTIAQLIVNHFTAIYPLNQIKFVVRNLISSRQELCRVLS